MDAKKKLMLIDGNSIINRAYYALPLLTNSEGEFTNGVYGFLTIFFRLYDEERPDYTAVAFDLRAPTFRHKKYEEYKATRKSMPDELRPQMPLLKNLLGKMRIKIYEAEGYEADDVLGTLARAGAEAGMRAVVVTGDRDLLQIADEDIKIRIPKTKSGKTEVEDYSKADVVDKIGVTPREYIDVKALMGDSADNIPGVPGIGEKTALKIIREFGSVENAIDNASLIKPKKASENLIQHKDLALLSKELATICTSAPVTLLPEEMTADRMFNAEAAKEIARLNFKSLFARFAKEENPFLTAGPDHPAGPDHTAGPGHQAGENRQAEHDHRTGENRQPDPYPPTDPYRPADYALVPDAETAAKLLAESGDLTAFATIFLENKPVGFAFSYGASQRPRVYFIKISAPRALEEGASLDEDTFVAVCKPFLTSKGEKITLDYKRELTYWRAKGVDPVNVRFDALLAAYILDSSKGAYDYTTIAWDLFQENFPLQEELLGKGRNRTTVDEADADLLLNYACGHADVIWRGYPIMRDKLTQNEQRDLYYNIEMPLAEVLWDMERHGIKVDRDALEAYGQVLGLRLETLIGEIYDLAGEEFNINSPAQLGAVLFDKLGLKGTKKNTQGYSTAAEVLERLAFDHPIVPKILEYRSYTKLKSTYVDGLLAVLDPTAQKIYSTFNQTVTSTGRISSTEPNLQNIPIRLELGRQLRKVFVPTEGFVFLDGDYSQIELRVLAHMANDETLISAFKNGQDIHRLTASQVFKTPFELVTLGQRSNAKAVNFGIVYGISAYGLSHDLNITVKEASSYIDGYFEKYPGVKKYLDESIAQAKRNGYASTIWGRRRLIPEFTSSNFAQRSFGERVAMNMPVQGTAADIIKLAMIRVHSRLKKENLRSRLILQVHDELLLEAALDELETVKAILKEEMENAAPLKVPLETDFHTGASWYDAK
ncbi:MAG: DNA polymerase I [Clostridiales bacterium]|jgi:DNA polymerase-1|nr:DNA polymerase I [Clostridiales bacterium]